MLFTKKEKEVEEPFFGST